MSKPSLLYVSILGTPDQHDPDRFADLPDSGNDSCWIANRLTEWGVADAVDLRSVNVPMGDELPEVADIDGVIVGGSVPSINDGFDWQERAMAWLEDWRSTGRPALGICGGHQMMCVMLGVSVEPLTGGPVHRSAPIRLTSAGRGHHLFEGFEDEPEFHFGHSDHVVEAPQGATVLADSPISPALALDYGGGWLSVQFHPEMSHDVIARAWKHYPPEDREVFPPLPNGPRILVNFMRGGNLLG